MREYLQNGTIIEKYTYITRIFYVKFGYHKIVRGHFNSNSHIFSLGLFVML